MLAAAVEEMNRYGESLQEVLEYLNIIPENKSSEAYVIKFVSGDYVKVLDKNYKGFSPNSFEYYIFLEDELKDLPMVDQKLYKTLERNFCEPFVEDGGPYIQYDPGKLMSFDPVTNVFTFAIERGGVEAKLLVERVPNLNLDLKNYGMMF